MARIIMSEQASIFSNIWSKRCSPVEGIHSFGEWKFYIVFLMYMGSLVCLAHDPFFLDHGHFIFARQNIITIFLAYIVGASFCWEHPIFGKSSGANFLLQCLMMMPLSLLVARILVQPPSNTILMDIVNKAIGAFRSTVFNPESFIPEWLIQLFQNWKLSLFAVLVTIGLSVRKLQYRISAVLTFLVIPFAITITKGGELRWLIAGLLIFLVGLALQFCRYDRVIYYENVARRLISEGGDKAMINLATKIMVQLEERKAITEKNLLVLVHNEYQKTGDFTETEYRMIAAELVQLMIYRFDFIAIQNDSNGVVIKANPALWNNDNLMMYITVVPRMIVIAFLMICWILAPVDIVPDSIPFLGALDDVVVALVSSIALKETVSEKRLVSRF